MIYNSSKIKELLNSIEDNLTEEQQSIVKKIVFNYNKLWIYASKKKIELDEKRKIYFKESEENYNLREENIKLEKEIEMLKEQNREQRRLLKKAK